MKLVCAFVTVQCLPHTDTLALMHINTLALMHIPTKSSTHVPQLAAASLLSMQGDP
jgi:hypothetical protein